MYKIKASFFLVKWSILCLHIKKIGTVMCFLFPNSRIIMLETVAGVPGMIAAMARHFDSLRKLTRDHGWIHTLLGIDS